VAVGGASPCNCAAAAFALLDRALRRVKVIMCAFPGDAVC
jgi:hypothetical protein